MAGFASALADRTTMAERKEFIEKAKKLKNDGNESYRKLMEECKKPVDERDATVLEKSQKEAKRFYHLARLQAQAAYPFNGAKTKTDSDETASTSRGNASYVGLRQEWVELIASIYNNLAAVILANPGGQKEEDYARAAEYCSNVLLLQKENSKAMYRKAQALEKMGHLRRALNYYRDADLVEKHQNAAVHRDYLRLKAQIAEATKQSSDELKDNIRQGISKSGLGVSTDSVVYGKRERKKKPSKKRYGDSPSRGSSSSPSPSPDSGSSSSGRSSDEE